jgi:hypothetical protein
MFRAREDEALPIGYSDALLCLHARRPYSFTPAEIAELAAQIRDPSFRIQVGSDGIHIFNRDGLHSGTDPFALFPKLKLEDDGAHAFYIGVELARAQTAWQLGKSYSQDEELDWGVAADKVRKDESKDEFQAAGHTLAVKREKAAAQREKTREKSRAKTAAKPAPARKARLKTKPKPKAKR